MTFPQSAMKATLLVLGLHQASLAQPAPEPLVPQRELLGSTLWIQTAHEYRFGAAQVYQLAQRQLSRAVQQAGSASLEQDIAASKKRPPAIVLDIDETVLDNSPFQAWQVRAGQPYSDTAWSQWVSMKQAKAVPGAVEFTRTAQQQGVRVFYVSNRQCKTPGDCPAKADTMANMKALGFARADDPNAFLLRNEKPEWAGDKVTRRQAVGAKFRIVMLVGDDLQDFMSADQAKQLRLGQNPDAAKYEKLFGSRWFVLANPMYGSWERALPAGLPGHYAALSGAPLSSAPANGFALATWNLEWLMTPATFDALAPNCDRNGQPGSQQRAIPCTNGRLTIAKRSQEDFDALARVAERTKADVIALQEVDGPEAAALVFRQGWTVDCFVSRAHPQKVGFAIREGIPYRCNPEFAALDIDQVSRAGADITIFPDKPNAIRLLSVHLKSGCFQGPLSNTTNEACPRLRAQVPVLEQWIDARASEGVAYAVLGDFNRRLELDAGFSAGSDESAPTSMFQALSDGVPAGAVLFRATEGQPDVKCSSSDRNPPSPIDNILISQSLKMLSTSTSYQRVVFDNDEATRLKLSDHCPGVLTLQGLRSMPNQ